MAIVHFIDKSSTSFTANRFCHGHYGHMAMEVNRLTRCYRAEVHATRKGARTLSSGVQGVCPDKILSRQNKVLKNQITKKNGKLWNVGTDVIANPLKR